MLSANLEGLAEPANPADLVPLVRYGRFRYPNDPEMWAVVDVGGLAVEGDGLLFWHQPLGKGIAGWVISHKCDAVRGVFRG